MEMSDEKVKEIISQTLNRYHPIHSSSSLSADIKEWERRERLLEDIMLGIGAYLKVDKKAQWMVR